MNNELILVSYENENPTVLGRDLHEKLGIKEQYTDWMNRMIAYGFAENVDYITFSAKSENVENRAFGDTTNIKPKINHQLTLEMAKHIAMVQRSKIGMAIRKYFIECEEKLKASYQIADPIKRAEKWIEEQKEKKVLAEQVAEKEKQLKETEPKVEYHDKILQSDEALSITIIAKDYGLSGTRLNKMLKELKIQFKPNKKGPWLLYAEYANKGYTTSQTYAHEHKDGSPASKVHTYWTQKGRAFLYEKLKAINVFPLCERVNTTEVHLDVKSASFDASETMTVEEMTEFFNGSSKN